MTTKRPYEKPEMNAYAVKEIVDLMGPAQAAGASNVVETHPFSESTLKGRPGSTLNRR